VHTQVELDIGTAAADIPVEHTAVVDMAVLDMTVRHTEGAVGSVAAEDKLEVAEVEGDNLLLEAADKRAVASENQIVVDTAFGLDFVVDIQHYKVVAVLILQYTKQAKLININIIIIIIIIIIKGIYGAQDHPKATSALCQQWKLSTV